MKQCHLNHCCCACVHSFFSTPVHVLSVGSSTISYTHQTTSVTSINFQPFFSNHGVPDNYTDPADVDYFPFGWIENIDSSAISRAFYATLSPDLQGSVALLTNGGDDSLGYIMTPYSTGFTNPDFSVSSIGNMVLTITDCSP